MTDYEDSQWQEKLLKDGKIYSICPTISLDIEIGDVVVGGLVAKQKIEKVFFLLSQTKIGQKLLSEGLKSDVKIIIDDKNFIGRESTNAYLWKNNIYMRSSMSSAELSLILVHELMHIQQNSYDIGVKHIHELRLDQAIQLEWAFEAEAYAVSAQFALELANRSKDAPKDSWTSYDAMQALKVEIPDAYLIACAISNIEDIYNGKHMALQFIMFYSDDYTRNIYANYMLAHFNRIKALDKIMVNARSYKKELPKGTIKDKFNYLGKAYLKEHAPESDLSNSKYYSAMPKQVKNRIVEFYQNLSLITHFRQKRAVKNIPSYSKADIAPKIYIPKNSN